MVGLKKSKEQLLAVIEEKEKKLAAQKAKLLLKIADLSKDSLGMQSLLDAVQYVSDKNNVEVSEVIKAVAKMKRTGLTIEKAAPKPSVPRDPNAPKLKRGRKPKVQTL